MNKLITLLALTGSLLALPLQAADRWYAIEVIIFKQHAGVDGESWGAQATHANLANSIPTGPVASPAKRVPYARLPESALTLQGEWARLAASGRYEPVKYLAWAQPGVSKKNARRIRVTSEAGIQGTIQIGLSRYLHVYSDLYQPWGSAPASESGQNWFGDLMGGDAERPGNMIRFQDHIRMRSGELHYVDHPRMGMLVTATRIKAP